VNNSAVLDQSSYFGFIQVLNSTMSDSVKSTSHSLLVIILDISPLAWGERDLRRTAQDKQRAAQEKRSVGPAILEEVLESVQALAVAVSSIERSSGILVLGVADNESAVVFPRKDQLETWLRSSDSYSPNTRRLQQDMISGVSELIQRAASKAAVNKDKANSQAAMAAAFSKALCLINRFHVAAQTGFGVSALSTAHYMNRVEDEGVVALMGSKSKKKSAAAHERSAWAPRILILQASDDRSRDYNAFMNCAFAAAKHHVTVDGCFLTVGGNCASSSSFLEQACDLTGGVFLAPSGAAQVGGALTEVLFTVFLAPLSCRPQLNLPALHKVDFRARCFDSGETVDMAFVCNQCLSIFKHRPKSTHCPTCHATIVGHANTRSATS
jgi:transcription initiation factor TFIIH subunit 3